MKEECAGRPRGMIADMKHESKVGLIDRDIGPFWKDQKRFVLKTLRDYGFGRKSEENIREETQTLINHLIEQNTEGKDFLIEDNFNISVVNVIWKMVANKTFALDSPDGLKFVRTLDEIFSKRDPKMLIPIIGRFTEVRKNRLEMFRILKERFYNTIEEHEKSLDESDPRDLIDNYLLEIRKGRDGFNKDELYGVIFDLFAAGSETTSTTLRWAILFLILNPEVQKQCHQELDKISGAIPSLSDMDSLHYCQATILEILRVGSTAPGTLVHQAMSNVEVGGYKLKKGTLLVGNFFSTHFDEEYWEDPQQFRPERFLSEDGKILTDTPNFFPFSVGKRVCLGESLAKVELFLFFTAIVKSFQFDLPKHHNPPDPDDFTIVITKIPKGFYCNLSER